MSSQDSCNVDFLVVGSGAGALTGAIRAHDLGLNTLIVEKSGFYGGTSAMSGGSLWIPNNHLMASVGIKDSDDEALTYLANITKGEVEESRLRMFIRKGAEMLKYLDERGDLKCDVLPKYCDYYPNAPGAKPGARTLEASQFSTLKLGRDLRQLRAPHPGCVTFGILHMSAADAYRAIRGDWRFNLTMLKKAVLYFAGLPLRLIAPRSTRVTLGNALVASLRWGVKKRSVPLWLNSPAKELLVENDRVVGAIIERDGKKIRVRAKRGVLLASGGFEQNPVLRQHYLPKPTSTNWSAANKHNTGDALQMTETLQPALALMDDAWWTPATLVPGAAPAYALVFEKSMPHSLFVNSQGERFTNEAAPYIDVVNGMYANHIEGEGERSAVPCWMIFDASYRKKTAIAGSVYPSTMMPDSIVPDRYWNTLIYKGDTLSALAHRIGIDAQNLQRSVMRFNRFAQTGVDEDFARGGNASDNYYSDPSCKPNPNLGALETGPFYAVPIVAGDIGTKGGLLTDADARVLREDRSVIAGLYACGNCSAAVMGRSYAGAGSTLGPAMAFGFVAAETAARN
ncbi:MAG TPA: FAD-binding protein [Pseudomonadales bacterium]|nr:FAD-binding protein [Pseudomonadales bacterium]